MGLSLLSITAKFKQEEKQDQAIRSLTEQIEKFYEPITKAEFLEQIRILREVSEPLTFFNGNTNECIDFCEWFDNLLAPTLNRDFISKLEKFSKLPMEKKTKQLVSFFKIDRFCELRALAAALDKFQRAYLSKPNSINDAFKKDLIIENQGKTFAVQIKAGKRKKQEKSTIDSVINQNFINLVNAIEQVGIRL